MLRVPVAGDVDAAGDPDLFVVEDIVDEAGEGSGAARAADQAAVQADVQHLRLAGLAFTIKDVEGILQIGEELIAGIEPLRR